MSQQMTITRVMEGDEWGNDYGRNQSYTLDLEMVDGSVVQDIVSNRKIKDDGTHKEPQENEVVWGDLLPMPKGQRKLKLDYDAMKEHGSGGGSHRSSETSTSNNSKPASSGGETNWTERNAEIRRQHSQQVAIEIMAARQPLTGATEDDAKAMIKAWADWFDQDAIAAGQYHATAGEKTDPGASANPPVNFSGARKTEPDPVAAISQAFDATPVPDDTHQWIENELIVGGAGSTEAGALATYAIEKLRPEQRATLESELRHPDSEAKAAGLRRLEQSYVKAEGHAVPTVDLSEPDLPF